MAKNEAAEGELYPLLFPEDVARILTEERRKTEPDAPAYKVDTIHSMTMWSRPGYRYEKNPTPEALARRGPRQPAWYAYQEQEWIDWFHSRPGRGFVARRPRKNPPKPTGKANQSSTA